MHPSHLLLLLLVAAPAGPPGVLLLAQAMAEPLLLMTSDAVLKAYPAPVLLV